MKINVEKINWLRVEKGLSIRKLCEKSEISNSTMSRLLKSKCDTRPDTIGKIAQALNVKVRDLFIEE